MVQYTLRKVYISNSNDPAFNLAFEEYLVNSISKTDEVLYLWQNQNTVVIGRNQNPWKECNWKRLYSDGGKMVRRLSGGGAVFHDLGNLNFTFITKDDENKVEENIGVIIEALKSLGIDAYFSGKNDILVDGNKISGNAYFSENEILCHHGTLLIDADITKLSNYLKVSELKLKSKGIDSVKSRVINIKEINCDLTVDILIDTLTDKFNDELNSDEIYFIDENSESHLSELINKYNSWEWNFGSSPQFDIELRNRFEWGEVDINLIVEDGVIEDIKVYSDCNDTNLSQKIEDILNGIKFQKEDFLESVYKINDDSKSDLINWFRDIDF